MPQNKFVNKPNSPKLVELTKQFGSAKDSKGGITQSLFVTSFSTFVFFDNVGKNPLFF